MIRRFPKHFPTVTPKLKHLNFSPEDGDSEIHQSFHKPQCVQSLHPSPADRKSKPVKPVVKAHGASGEGNA